MTNMQPPEGEPNNMPPREGSLQDNAATQPPYMDEHEFNIRLADNDNYDGLTFEVVEAEVAEGKRVVSRGVYLAPNLITTLSLLSGFYSILASTQGEFYKAAFHKRVTMLSNKRFMKSR